MKHLHLYQTLAVLRFLLFYQYLKISPIFDIEIRNQQYNSNYQQKLNLMNLKLNLI